MKSRIRPIACISISCLITCLAPWATFASPAAPSFASERVVADDPSAGVAEGNLQLAGRRAANEAKPPERGSSASLYGGSSADRYGSNSADHNGVAGQRDSRLYRKQVKHDDAKAPKPKVEDDQDQDVEEP